MSILIKGMEMPKRGHTVTLTIMGGGEAVVQYYDCKPQLTVPIVYKAVPVPQHGRLIDADALKNIVYAALKDALHDDNTTSYGAALCAFVAKDIADEIEAAPTIIPAEEGE